VITIGPADDLAVIRELFSEYAQSLGVDLPSRISITSWPRSTSPTSGFSPLAMMSTPQAASPSGASTTRHAR
jgi:hypothetical protein